MTTYEVVGLSITENDGESAGLVTLKGENGSSVDYDCTPDEAKSLRIGQAVRLKLVRVRSKSEEVPQDDRQVTIDDIVESIRPESRKAG